MMNENLSNTARNVKTSLERIPSLTVAGDSGLPRNFYLSFISVPAVIQLDGGGNLVCSFRHINTIMKISRGKKAAPVGQIIWKLSGDADNFELTDKQKTCYQHYVRFDGNHAITCFDNRNDSHDTRLVRYVFDCAHRKVMQVDTHCIKGKYSSACGSVHHIKGGIYVIGWGKAEYENDPHINERECMTVYDFDRDKVLMLISMDSHHGFNFTYRCSYCE